MSRFLVCFAGLLATCTCFFIPQCKRSSHLMMTKAPTNKKLEVYTKVKRLKQMIEGGQSYQDFVTEQRKYEGGEKNSIENESTNQTNDQESMKDNDVEYQATFRKAVAAGLISASADPVEVMKKVLQYKAANKSGSNAGTMKKITTKRIAFLPDGSVDDSRRFFYADLVACFREHNDDNQNQLQPLSFDILGMPYVYELNTKRYEVTWMAYMRTLQLSQYDLIVGHKSSAEALLRYLESEQDLHHSKIMLVDGSDIYTAGERHGRAYRYSLIQQNCASVRIVCTTQGMKEATTLCTELADKIARPSSDQSSCAVRIHDTDPLQAAHDIFMTASEFICMD